MNFKEWFNLFEISDITSGLDDINVVYNSDARMYEHKFEVNGQKFTVKVMPTTLDYNYRHMIPFAGYLGDKVLRGFNLSFDSDISGSSVSGLMNEYASSVYARMLKVIFKVKQMGERMDFIAFWAVNSRTLSVYDKFIKRYLPDFKVVLDGKIFVRKDILDQLDGGMEMEKYLANQSNDYNNSLQDIRNKIKNK